MKVNQRILVVKIAAIGDVVMALTMIPAVKARYPDARLTWMGGRQVRPLLDLVPGIDEIIEVDDKGLFAGSITKRLSTLFKVLWKTRFRYFDLVLTGNPSPLYRLLTLSVRAGNRRSFHRGRGRPWPIPGRYHGYEYARLVMGEDGPEMPLATFPPVKSELPDELEGVLDPKARGLVALAPGGARNLLREDGVRRWPAASYAKLGRRLVEQGYQVVLLGHDADAWVLEDFSGVRITDLIGRTSLVHLTAMIGKSDLLISHDTAAIHLAVLMDTPCLALFGPTDPREKVPGNFKGRVLWGGEHLACRPCYDGRSYHSCRNNLCLKELSVQKVSEAALELLR